MVSSTADQHRFEPVSTDNIDQLLDLASASQLHRAFVQPDNSCLFATVSFLCQGVTGPRDLKAASRKLREICALTVLADPEPAARAAMLGHASVESCARLQPTAPPPVINMAFALARYAAWIRDYQNWGGEPEVC